MIKFPEWVNMPTRQSKAKLATKRLRFIIINAAIQTHGGGTLAQATAPTGKNRTTITTYIRGGKLSRSAAQAFENAYGRNLICAEWLTNPLDIVTK